VHEVRDLAGAVIADKPAPRVMLDYPAEERGVLGIARERVYLRIIVTSVGLLSRDVEAREVMETPVVKGNRADVPGAALMARAAAAAQLLAD
jgi:hypothetical protein